MMLSLLACSLLVASVGFIGANPSAGDSQNNDTPSQNSSALVDGGVGPQTSADAIADYVPVPVDYTASLDTLAGTTWTFNVTLTGATLNNKAVNFESGPDGGFGLIAFVNDKMAYAGNGSQLNVYDQGVWLSQSYRTITFIDGTDIADSSLIAFMETNAVLYVPPSLGDQIVDVIASGLGVITALGGALVDGFDGIALDDGNLSVVVTFAFVLFGIGISVGICKKTFNWITGRHGM